MAITGVHGLFYTPEAEKLREIFRDVFKFSYVDAHDGWLIFALPPAELGIHPDDKPWHEITFMCDDINATVADLKAKGIEFTGDPEPAGFGVKATMILPGDVQVMVYEPRHKTAI
jgi:hypothetical protein